MIQPYSYLKVADNTGAKRIMVIRVSKGCKPNAATLGDIVTVSVKEAAPTATVKRKSIAKAVIVRLRRICKRSDGTTIKFDDNAAVIVNPDGTPKGSRIFGPIAKEVSHKGYTKIATLATEIY